MTLQTFDVEQGTPAWHDLRRGIVTASTVGKLVALKSLDPDDLPCHECGSGQGDPCVSVTKGKSGPLKTFHPARYTVAKEAAQVPAFQMSDDYALNLMTERITGKSEYVFVNRDMERGVICEPIARNYYSEHYAPVVECGFMRLDDGNGWSLGWSPDGLVGDDGAIEIKSPRAKTHVKTMLTDEVPAQYMAQCQAGLLVSGRAWLDFVSFHGGLPLYVKRVYPDGQWFLGIAIACARVQTFLNDNTAAYERAATGRPATERVDYFEEIHA